MVLLDTCVVIWLATDSTRISERARSLIRDDPGGIFVSAISGWEIAIKSSQGKLDLPMPVEIWYPAVLKHHGFAELPITGGVAIASALLPRIHNDPADRLIVATAMNRSLPLLTPDPYIASYTGVQVVW